MYKVIGSKNKFVVSYIDINDRYLVFKSNHSYKNPDEAVLVASIFNTYNIPVPLDWKKLTFIEATVDKSNFVKMKIIDSGGRKWQESQNLK